MHFLTRFKYENFPNLKVLYIANDAPLSSKDGLPAEYYNTGYHQEIFEILCRLKLDVWSTRDSIELINLTADFNYVFTLLNRLDFHNPEVFISSICEYHNLKYLGAKPNIRALAEDKHLTKIMARSLGIPTSDWMLYRVDDKKLIPPSFQGPYFLKWRNGASSLDVEEDNCVDSWEAAIPRIENFHMQNKDVILERLLLGESITVPVLTAASPWALPGVLSESDKKFGLVTFSQARRLEGGLTRKILTDQRLDRVLRYYSIALFEAVKPVDYIRVDFRIDHISGIPQLLEFNICCNISSRSAICLSANHIGISHEELVGHILNQSLIRQGFHR